MKLPPKEKVDEEMSEMPFFDQQEDENLFVGYNALHFAVQYLFSLFTITHKTEVLILN